MTRHTTDYASLAFGLLFAAAGVVLAVERLDAISLAWVAPLTAIVIGAILIIAGRAGQPKRDDRPDEEAQAPDRG
jgi:hypothetical protein